MRQSVVSVSLLFVLASCDPGGSMERRELASHETSAIIDVADINKAQAAYYGRTSKYAASLSELCGSVNGPSRRICRGEVHGYVFTVASSSPTEGYAIDARPKTPGSSGRRFFYSDQSMIIRQSENGPATGDSPEVR
jgi:hypothetical protein